MSRVRIVTDSTAEIPEELVSELGISVVPMYVCFGGQTYRDGTEIDRGEFYQRLSRGTILPTTSPPAADDFHRCYERLRQETDQILSIHISSKLSRTLEIAESVAQRFFGASRILTVDSQQTSWGLGLLVVEAARRAALGDDLDSIVRRVRGMISKIYIVLYVTTFEYLRRGGRIGKARSVSGSTLTTRPLLVLEDGEITPLELVRSRGRALDRLVEFVMEFPRIVDITVMQGRPTLEAQELLMRLNEVLPGNEINVRSYGPVLATHVGPDAVGVIIHEGE